MSTSPPVAPNFNPVTNSLAGGLALAEHRVAQPEATVICVHGGLDRATSFSRLARRLETMNVLAYDRRGYQGSRILGPGAIADHVDDLVKVVLSEGEQVPIILVGHSFGGVIALAAALQLQDRVALVFAYESPLPWVLARVSGRPPLTDDAGFEAEQFFRRVISKSAWDRLSDHERTSRQLDGPALVADLTSLVDGPPFDLRLLTSPTLYVYGDGPLGEYSQQLAERLAALNPHISSRQIVGAGHGAHLTNPDQLALLIIEQWRLLCASR